MRLTSVASVFFIAIVGTDASAAPPDLPPLGVELLLQAPPDAELDWKALEGNIVVVEFWNTRCGPCIYALPALNRLHDSLHDERVIFLYISDEPENVVRTFLMDHPITGWVGIDSDSSLFSALEVKALPSTFIVSKTGHFLGWTDPLALTKEGIIQKLLAGKEAALSPDPILKADPAPRHELDEQELPLTLLSIGLHRSPPPFPAGGDASDDRIVGVTLLQIIGRLFEVQAAQVVFEGMAPDARKFDIRLRWPRRDFEKQQQIARAVLETTFGIAIEAKRRPMEVLSLVVSPSAREKWEPHPVGVFYDAETGLAAADKEVLERMKRGERFFVALGGTGDLARNLSYAIGRPVIDEAHIPPSYSFWFPWDNEAQDRAERAKRQVEEKYGVVLTPAVREIDVLVVRPAATATPKTP